MSNSMAVGIINEAHLDKESKLKLLDIYHNAKKLSYSQIAQSYKGSLKLSKICASC